MRKICLIAVLLSSLFPVFAGGSAESLDNADAETRIVTDVWNRDVEIPANAERIIAIGSMGPRMAAYLDVVDMLIGTELIDASSMSVRYDYSPVYHDAMRKLPVIGTGGGSGENNAYPEEIIMLDPDVIIAGFSREACEELQRQTGIPVVSIRYRADGFIDEGFYRSLRLFADVVGAEERCEEILSYIDECKADLQKRTESIAIEDKARVYAGAVTFNGRHGFAYTYVNFPPFDAVNALNVADELADSQIGSAEAEAEKNGTAYIGSNGFEVDPEKIIEWDPDIIFLDPGNMDLVDAEYSANPGYFESLRAVQEDNVYTMPSSNSAGPNITYLLMNAYFAGKVLFPEEFCDIDFRAKSSEIMEKMLGRDFFQEMEEGGLYYGKITIGGHND